MIIPILPFRIWCSGFYRSGFSVPGFTVLHLSFGVPYSAVHGFPTCLDSQLLDFFQEDIQKFCCKSFFQRFWRRLGVKILTYNFSRFVYHLFCELALHWPFSILTENVHHSMKLGKYILKAYGWIGESMIHHTFLACEY